MDEFKVRKCVMIENRNEGVTTNTAHTISLEHALHEIRMAAGELLLLTTLPENVTTWVFADPARNNEAPVEIMIRQGRSFLQAESFKAKLQRLLRHQEVFVESNFDGTVRLRINWERIPESGETDKRTAQDEEDAATRPEPFEES